MELSPRNQVIKLFQDKEKILITTHAKPDGDAISSVLALFLILEKLGKKNIKAVCADPIPDVFNFLPHKEKFEQKCLFTKNFIMSLDCSKVSINSLNWTQDNGKLNIVISPKNGNFEKENVSFFQEKEDFDTIVCLDCADLKQIGGLFTNNTELFAENLIINIDHHISNTNYGKINLVDAQACSTTEVLFSLLLDLEKKFSKKILDKNIATLLLTGIITDTGSFQNPNTTPKSFDIAADLIEAGARQQEIIRRLFKTKNLSTLKLWGQVLSKIENDPLHRMVWAKVSQKDLQKVGAKVDELDGILDDLLSNAPGAEIVLLLKEKEDGLVSGSMRSICNSINSVSIARMFGGGGHRQAAGFKINPQNESFEIICHKVIKKIQHYQRERLKLYQEKKFQEKQKNPFESIKKDSNKEKKEQKNNAQKMEIDLLEKINSSKKSQNKKTNLTKIIAQSTKEQKNNSTIHNEDNFFENVKNKFSENKVWKNLKHKKTSPKKEPDWSGKD